PSVPICRSGGGVARANRETLDGQLSRTAPATPCHRRIRSVPCPLLFPAPGSPEPGLNLRPSPNQQPGELGRWQREVGVPTAPRVDRVHAHTRQLCNLADAYQLGGLTHGGKLSVPSCTKPCA